MKKIITVSYYSDFSRFFELSISPLKNQNIKWLNLCIYPSGYIYSKVHKINCIYLPNAVNKIQSTSFDISTEAITKLCKYHGYNKNTANRAKKYLIYYENLIKSEKPDLIILSGDSRLPITTLCYLAKQYNINVLYFEQGPLNTTILDKKGVNANCSFRMNTNISKNEEILNAAKKQKVQKWNGYKKYRIIDIINSFIKGKQQVEIVKYILPKIKNNKPNISNKKIDNQKYALLVLQVPEDANMIFHSPYFKDHFSIVRDVYHALMIAKPEYSLIVREHPLYINKYESTLYEFIANNNNIYLDPSSKLNTLIEKSELVFVNNSTVGLETMALGKPLIVLGDSYYDNHLYVNKYNGENLDKLITSSINNKEKTNKAKERVNYLFENVFIKGHFRDLNIDRFTLISKAIQNEIS